MKLAAAGELLRAVEEHGRPRLGLADEVNDWRERNYEHLLRGIEKISIVEHYDVPAMLGSLYVARLASDGTKTDFGLASLRMVTTVGANWLVDTFQGTVEPELMRRHDWGTGTNAEAVSDTALQTPYGGSRGFGSLGEGASANVFRTVGSSAAFGSQLNITEHGLFNDTTGGILLDRSVFAAVTIPAGEAVATTYDLTINTGG